MRCRIFSQVHPPQLYGAQALYRSLCCNRGFLPAMHCHCQNQTTRRPGHTGNLEETKAACFTIAGTNSRGKPNIHCPQEYSGIDLVRRTLGRTMSPSQNLACIYLLSGHLSKEISTAPYICDHLSIVSRTGGQCDQLGQAKAHSSRRWPQPSPNPGQLSPLLKHLVVEPLLCALQASADMPECRAERSCPRLCHAAHKIWKKEGWELRTFRTPLGANKSPL